MQFETSKIGALTLQPVNQQALLDIMLEISGGDLAALESVTPTTATLTASNRLLTYVLGWVVVETPTDADLATLAALGKRIDLPQIARANWLRYLVLSNTEASAIIAAVMGLSFREP